MRTCLARIQELVSSVHFRATSSILVLCMGLKEAMAQPFQPRQTHFMSPGFQLMPMPAVGTSLSTEEHWPGLPSIAPAVESSSQSPPDCSNNLLNPEPWQELVHTNCRQLAQAPTGLPKLVGPTQEFKDSLNSSASPASITRCPQRDRLKIYAKLLNSCNSCRRKSPECFQIFPFPLSSVQCHFVSSFSGYLGSLDTDPRACDMGRLRLRWASLIP